MEGWILSARLAIFTDDPDPVLSSREAATVLAATDALRQTRGGHSAPRTGSDSNLALDRNCKH